MAKGSGGARTAGQQGPTRAGANPEGQLARAKADAREIWGRTLSAINTKAGGNPDQAQAIRTFAVAQPELWRRMTGMLESLVRERGGNPQLIGFANQMDTAIRQLEIMTHEEDVTKGVASELHRFSTAWQGWVTKYKGGIEGLRAR